jgi:hypothetical protein
VKGAVGFVAVTRIDKTGSGFADTGAETVNSFFNGYERRFVSSFHRQQGARFVKCQEKADFLWRDLLALEGKCPHEMKSKRFGGIACVACRPGSRRVA